MKRREFLVTTALAAVGSSFAFGRKGINWLEFGKKNPDGVAKISHRLEGEFSQLIQWLKENGWTAYITQALDVNFSQENDALRIELTKELDKSKLAALRSKQNAGYDDFA